MESTAVEDHIKYEAEEAENMTEHVWEEVEIEDENVPAWKQDLEMEAETEMNEDLTMSESEEPSMEITNPASEESVTADDITEEQIDSYSQEVITGDVEESEYKLEQNGEESQENPTGETIDAVEAIVVDPNAEDGTVPGETTTETITGDIETQASTAMTMPIVTNVTSFASQPVQKMINLSNLKLLSKGGGYVNIGNKKVKLVPISGDRKLAMGGKFVRIANPTSGGNKNLLGKVFTLPGSPEKKLIPAKVVSVPSTANRIIAPAPAPLNIVNQKVVPAKVVSVPNTKLRPIAPNPGNEVTIFITGIAGDKVTVKDSGQLLTTATRVPIKIAPQPTVRKVVQQVHYQSDHADACISSDQASDDQGETLVVTPQLISDGHFLLQGSDSNHGTTTTFACNVCDRQFTQLKYLLSHQQTHILPEPVSCDFCDKTFKRRYDLVRHKRRAHIDNTIYECDVCHKQFADRLIANRHRLTHTEEFKYCCEVCSRPFKYVHDLKRHRSIHFDEKPFECEICGKKFKHKSNLKTHQATHYSEKPYSCTLCDKRFHQKGNLKTHLIVHTGEMPFICTICSKRFHTRSGLLNHSYSHSDEKPFQCEICDKTFNWKSGLLTHQQTHRQRLMTNEEVQVIEIGPIPGDGSQASEHITVVNHLPEETQIAV